MVPIILSLLATVPAPTISIENQLERIAQAINAPRERTAPDFRNAVVIGRVLYVDVVSAEPVPFSQDELSSAVRQQVCVQQPMRIALASPSVEFRFKVAAPNWPTKVVVTVRGADCASTPTALARPLSSQTTVVLATPKGPARVQSQPASGGLVYLECETQQGATAVRWQITLNEAAGTVDYYTDGSGQQRRAARFTQDKVFFIGFALSRVDLTLHRQLGDAVENGTCRMSAPQARAF